MLPNHTSKSKIKLKNQQNQQKQRNLSEVSENVFRNKNQNDKETENELMRNFCNYWCQVKKKPQQSYFTKDELIKMRQKRPKIQTIYKMRPLNSSQFDMAMKDIKQICQLIDKL